MSGPIVLYLGPSVINNAPIVVLATLDSSNVKTGPMIQTWILPVDGPLDASREATDDSVCGDCPRRRSTGGDCYVRLDAAPHSAWKRWVAHGSPGENWADPEYLVPLTREAQTVVARLGAYGDPAAVPSHVWRDLIDAVQPRVVTGYTHQWRAAHAADLRTLVMASCDSVDDARQALSAGWRYFAAVPTATHASEMPGRAVQCLSDARGLTCEECGICDGARENRERQPTSVWIAEHGPMSSAKAHRAVALRVAP